MTNELTQTFAFGEAKVTIIIEDGNRSSAPKKSATSLGIKIPVRHRWIMQILTA